MRNPSLPAYIAGLALILCSLQCIAQEPSDGSFAFSWGDTYKLPKKHADLGFIGNTTDGYVQIGHRPGKSLSLQKFDPQLHLVSEKTVDLGELPGDYSNEQFARVGNKYFWFFSTWERSEQKERLFVQEYNIRSNTMQGNARELLSSDKLTGITTANGYFSYRTYGKWNFYQSMDSSKMLVQYRKKPEVRDDSKNKDIIGFQVFDGSMNKLWGREIRMPYTEEKMDNADYQVDRQGNVYTLAKVYDGGKARKNAEYHYEILKWSEGQDKATIIPFRFSNKYVNTAMITEDPQGTVMVGGYYSTRKNSANADGFFLLKVDQGSNELVSVKKGVYEFPADVLKQFESRRARRRIEKKDKEDKAEAQNLELRKLVIGSDGSVNAYGEEFFLTVHTYTYMNGRTTSTRTVVRYYYQDILAVQINPEGELDWVRKVPKNQVGAAGRGGMSFKEFSIRNQHYFFFLDNIHNLDLREDQAPDAHADGAGGVLMSVRLDGSGKLSKSLVFDTRKEKKRLSVADFNDVGNNQMIVRARGKKGKSQPALITF